MIRCTQGEEIWEHFRVMHSNLLGIEIDYGGIIDSIVSAVLKNQILK